MLYESYNRNLGVRNMDWILYEYYCQILEKLTKEDPRDDKRMKIKLLKAIET